MAKKTTKVKIGKSAREDRVKKMCEAINKDWAGEDKQPAVTYLKSTETVAMERWSSGCPALDYALGGGWPRGRFVELYGPEAGGKSTISCHAIAEHQLAYPDDDVGFIDTEYTFDEEYAQALGVDTDLLLFSQPESGEQALNVLEKMMELGLKLIIVDSVAALTTRAELEGDIGDSHVATQARLMSTGLRRLAMVAGRNRATVIWTNQMRDKIGVTWGDKTTTPAGRALKHYASIRVNIARIGSEKEGPKDNPTFVSNRVKAECKKNKTAPPFRRAEFYISFGTGIDNVRAVFDDSLESGLLSQKGSWFSYGQIRLGQGKGKALDFLREHDVVFQAIKDGKAEDTLDDSARALLEAAEEPEDTEAPEEVPIFKKPSGSKSKSDDADADDSGLMPKEVAVQDA